MFLLGIVAAFLLILTLVSFSVFMASPAEVSPVLVFNKPKVDINMDVFSSSLFQSLVPFVEMQKQFSYKATDKNKKAKSGFVTATDYGEAQKVLTAQGLTVSELKEAAIGRDNPFTPYYGYQASSSSSSSKSSSSSISD
jgi:hypothetical protein